jgi:hypothetical protein
VGIEAGVERRQSSAASKVIDGQVEIVNLGLNLGEQRDGDLRRLIVVELAGDIPGRQRSEVAAGVSLFRVALGGQPSSSSFHPTDQVNRKFKIVPSTSSSMRHVAKQAHKS